MPIFRALRRTKAAAKVVVIGNFGAGNVGDELILAGFLKKLASRLPRARVTVLGHDPRVIRRWHGVHAEQLLPFGWRSLLSGRLFSTLRVLRAADAVVFPGGGLFTDRESAKAVPLWGFHILVAKWYWRPVYLLGQSVGPLSTDFGRHWASRFLGKAEWIGVRDTASATELKKLGISPAQIKVGEDSALLLGKLRKSQPSFVKRRTSRRILRVLVSVRDFPRVPPSFFKELAQALDDLTEQDKVRITFAEFGLGDTHTWQRLCLHAQHDSLWKVLELPESAIEVVQAIEKYDLVIGMRLHSLVTAHLAGVPSIALSYSRKVAEFQKQVGRGKQVLEVRNFKAKKLLTIFKNSVK